jgi:short-subunit dehydrogenase
MNAGADKGLVLVTGASAGLGEAFARAYAARGRDLALVARRTDRLEALAAELKAQHGVASLVVPADLSVLDAHKPILERISAEGRWVQTLVNNAGFGVPQDYTDVPWERQRDFLMTLVMSACGLAYGTIPEMIARRSGAILNVASMAGLSPGGAGHTLYPAAKSFAIKFSQSLASELNDKGIRVTAVCPGFTLTEFNQAAGTQHLMDKAPRHFWQTAEEVVAITLKANDAGRIVVVPGLHNKLTAAMMRYLPDSWIRAAIARGGAKYRIEKKE